LACGDHGLCYAPQLGEKRLKNRKKGVAGYMATRRRFGSIELFRASGYRNSSVFGNAGVVDIVER